MHGQSALIFKLGGCISPLPLCGRGRREQSDVAGEGDLKPHFMTELGLYDVLIPCYRKNVHVAFLRN